MEGIRFFGAQNVNSRLAFMCGIGFIIPKPRSRCAPWVPPDGVQVGDCLLALDGVVVPTSADVEAELAERLEAGKESVLFTLFRHGEVP